MKMQAIAAVAAALSLFTAATAGATTVGGLAGFTQSPEGVIPAVCIPGLPCELIPYNNFVPDPYGAHPAIIQWTSVPGNDIIGGISLGGANISTCIQIQCAPLDTVFYTYGNPFFGSTPTSAYQLTEVVREYDPAADPPDNLFNILAVINALVSGQHCCYGYADVSDPTAVRWSEGNVDYVLIPDPVFPLTAGWDPAWSAVWTPILKTIVDSAYTSRPIPTTTTTVTTAVVEPVISPVAVVSTSVPEKPTAKPVKKTTPKAATPKKPKKADPPKATTHPVTKKAAGANATHPAHPVKPAGKKPKVDR